MIERFIENELTLKRWRRFKKRKSSVTACILLFVSVVLTFTAPMIANSKPLMMKYKGETYFPVFAEYHPKDFGITDSFVVNYRKLDLSQDGDYAIWPIVKWNPLESNDTVDEYPSAPSSENWFGTDDRGRDVFARLLYGYKYSIAYAVLVWFLSTVIGVLLGGLMGYFGGKVDFFGQRVVEIFNTVPVFLLLLTMISIFKPSLVLLIVISSIFGWMGVSYYARGEFLRNRNLEFVEAARGMGAKTSTIIFKHILPNSLGPIITFAPFSIAGGITGLAGLDYLGFGLEVPTPSWGELLAQAHKNFTIAWWLAVFPSGALFTSLFLFVLVGDGVRDALDPKMK
ncbi:ABC transporter permease subunit [Bacteriovorax sp. DB6_IX]|uniref:ABC transporter permease subunit n=1 Tax=Bacteriovorax sp. DB6_IX TaxID=1353530 RepID=UPI00038A0E56|nr:ABC transporter permease subunit [Bacteriovorax sp. DB6_IX]EQC49631.1 ABC transporter, permease protein [Bacteriovorax sp. DB6_IX]